MEWRELVFSAEAQHVAVVEDGSSEIDEESDKKSVGNRINTWLVRAKAKSD